MLIFWRLRPYRLSVRTEAFQALKPGSTPGRVIRHRYFGGNARLAQLVERVIDVDDVTGSSPVPRTKVKILAIETSCDETAISLVECTGSLPTPEFKVLGNALVSQIHIHKEYGG